MIITNILPQSETESLKKIKELVKEGNIDGIGMQSHIGMSYPSIELFMRKRSENMMSLVLKYTLPSLI